MAYSDVILADTPAAYWRMNDASGQPQDSSGNGFHLTTVVGTPDYSQTGPFAAATAINLAAGECFRRLTGPAMTVTDNFTLEGWCKFVSCDTSRTGFLNGSGPGYEINILTGGEWRYRRDGGAASGLNANTQLSTASWQLIHLVRRAGANEYWYNAALDESDAGGGSPGTPAGNIEIGGGAGLAWLVSEVAFYASALSSTRIAAHYAASGFEKQSYYVARRRSVRR